MSTLFLGGLPIILNRNLARRLGGVTAAVMVQLVHADYNGTVSVAKLREEFDYLPAKIYDGAIKMLKSKKVLIVYAANQGEPCFDIDYVALDSV